MNMEDLERRLRVMEDVEEIKRLKARYCAYCDDNYNATAIASLFTEDAVWDGGIRGRADGRQGIHDFFFQASQRLPFAIHMVMNPDIEVNGDTATGSWYLFQACTYAEDNQAIWGVGQVRRGVCPVGRGLDVQALEADLVLLDSLRARLGQGTILVAFIF